MGGDTQQVSANSTAPTHTGREEDALAITAGLACCLGEDRNPTAVSSACRPAAAVACAPRGARAWRRPGRCPCPHVLESWVPARDAYWSVGRGLTDARAGCKTLLRLCDILHENGWPVKLSNPPCQPAGAHTRPAADDAQPHDEMPSAPAVSVAPARQPSRSQALCESVRMKSSEAPSPTPVCLRSAKGIRMQQGCSLLQRSATICIPPS